MATDQEIEQLFSSLRPRIADIITRSGKFSGRGNAGCCLMVLPIGGVFVLLMASKGVAFPSPEIYWGFVAGVLAVGALCFLVGWKLWRPWSRSNSALMAETNEELTRPLVDALVPGGTLSRPTVTTSGYHPSLLVPRQQRGSIRLSHQSRVDGRLADMPVVIEEIESSFDSNIHAGWVARFELPFAVAGHLRLWVSKGDWSGWAEWKDGFEPLPEATARLGAPHKVDVAPLGTGPDTAGAVAAPGALAPETLCTDALFDALRAQPDVSVAVVDRTLWVVLPRAIRVFVAHVASNDDLATWKKAALAVRDIEAVAREVLAAGTRT